MADAAAATDDGLPPEEVLGRALEDVQAALSHARNGDWDRVAACDARCRARVETVAGEDSGLDADRLADGLREIHGRYRELLALAEAWRNELAEAVRCSVRGRQGALAYEENRQP